MGDRDLALSLLRTGRLAAGESLTDVTRQLAGVLGVQNIVMPPSDAPVRTVVETKAGERLAFQDYFVRLRGMPEVRAFHFTGGAEARLSATVREALADPDLAGIIICPSNPYISIDPILAVQGLRGALKAAGVPIVAVSPIVGGDAVKGPLARILRAFSLPVRAATIARHYHGLLDGFVLDRADEPDAAEVEALGIATCVTDTLMNDDTRKARLADACLKFIATLARQAAGHG
jgi:LPPG:FO 2-phospho-L-lactate transferase